MRTFANLVLVLLCLNSYGQSGQLNTTFNGGSFIDVLAPGGSQADALLVQADGKVLAGGMAMQGNTFHFCITRYLPDGSRDASFGNGGSVVTIIGNSSYIRALALQPDGKILAGGSTAIGSGVFTLVRYRTDGTLDPSFGNGGMVFSALGNSVDVIKAIVLEPGGTILTAGETYNQTHNDLGFARFASNGSLMQAARLTVSTRNDFLMRAALQPDGKLLIVGSSFTATNTSDMLLVRLLPNLQPDLSFGSSGRVWRGNAGTDDFGKDLALLPDGKILVCGASYIPGQSFDLALHRFLPDGTIDREFGNDGTTLVDGNGTAQDAAGMAVQADGAILVGGSTVQNGFNDFVLYRFLHTGVPDNSFGANGSVTAAPGSYDDIAYAFAFTGSHVFLAGLSHRLPTGAPSDFALASFIIVNAILPVSFIDFYPEQHAAGVELHWKVDASGMESYIVERSSDGRSFNQLALVPAGNATGLLQYQFLDGLPLAPAGYYRIRGVEEGGASFYSNIILVRSAARDLQVFPNPATTFVQVSMPSGLRGHTRMQLFNASGSLAWEETRVLQGSNTVTTIPLASLAKGIYLLQVTSNGQQYTQKLVKE